MLAKRAEKVCLAFPLEGREDPARFHVTGRPVPETYTDRAHARAQLGIGADETAVLIFGGSLGARSINHAAVEAFKDAPYRIIHVAGTRDYPDLTAPGEHYVLLDYLTPFGIALAAADAAVARSGGSIFELAQYGLPAVLIPYPHATADHQTTNARWMTDAGAARVLPDAELTPERLRAETDAVLAVREDMAAAARGLAKPDAARTIAREVLAAAAAARRRRGVGAVAAVRRLRRGAASRRAGTSRPAAWRSGAVTASAPASVASSNSPRAVRAAGASCLTRRCGCAYGRVKAAPPGVPGPGPRRQPAIGQFYPLCGVELTDDRGDPSLGSLWGP